jgi:hypothetical protein
MLTKLIGYLFLFYTVVSKFIQIKINKLHELTSNALHLRQQDNKILLFQPVGLYIEFFLDKVC